MPIIATLEYRCYPLHRRYMVEEFINEHYDSFRRARPEALAALVGPSFVEDTATRDSYIIRASGAGGWELIVLQDATEVQEATEVRRAPLSAAAVATFFATLTVPFSDHSIGDDVETNYIYREALEARQAALGS